MRRGRGTNAFGIGNLAEVEVPDYAPGVGREGVVVEDDVS